MHGIISNNDSAAVLWIVSFMKQALFFLLGEDPSDRMFQVFHPCSGENATPSELFSGKLFQDSLLLLLFI